MFREGGRGFVQDEDARTLAERLDDFDELLFADTQPVDRGRWIDHHLEAVEQRLRLAMKLRPVDQPAARRRRAKEDVFRDGHLPDEREFLVNDGESRAIGIGDPLEMGGLVADEELALISAVRVQAAQELDERRFARAVFAAKRMDFAGLQVERDIAEGGDAGEGFGDVARGEEHGVEVISNQWESNQSPISEPVMISKH